MPLFGWQRRSCRKARRGRIHALKTRLAACVCGRHLHLYHGRNPNFIFTLGNFVTELANRNSKKTISIFAAYNPSEKIPSMEHFLPLAKHVSGDSWTLVDLRPLRPYFRAGMLETSLTPNAQKAFENIIFGFDFLLLVGDREKATFSVAQSEY